MSYVFTPEGYQELKRTIQESEEALLDKSKKRSSDSGQDVWHSEGYKLAVQEGAILDEMADELRTIFRSAKVVKPIEQNEKIMLGNGFIIRYKAGAVKKYYLDGFRIGNSGPERVANGSSMARVLEGAKVGDVRVLRFENGQKKTMTIEKIVLPSEVEQFLKE